MDQIKLFSDQKGNCKKNMARSGTFVDNMKLPIHRWYRYSAGFSAQWAAHEIEKRSSDTKLKVLDPFAGSGTTLLSASSVEAECVGFESHPFVFRIARAKSNWNVDTGILKSLSNSLIRSAEQRLTKRYENSSPLLRKCFDDVSFQKLEAMRLSFGEEFDSGNAENELLWLAITSIIRACSTAGTAQWQYVLPNKSKSKVLEPFEALRAKIYIMTEDIEYARKNGWRSMSKPLLTDARCPDLPSKPEFDFVLTSPPYPNNYDYADATRLEMTFWGEIKGWGDLHMAARQYLVRSCSQHSAKEKLILNDLLESSVLAPIIDELSSACRELEEIRLTKGGKKTYHTMAAAYFLDLGNVFMSLREVCKDGSELCFVIGDSAPYGVYLDAEKWLGKLALSAGFKTYHFEKLRDRNIKWKNRKHRVPLKEGRLWIAG